MPILVEILCPECEHQIREKINNISYGKTCQCPACSAIFEFRTEHITSVLRQAERAFRPPAPVADHTDSKNRQTS